MLLVCFRVIHADYGTRNKEFDNAMDLFGPYKNTFYWSGRKGGLIMEEYRDNNKTKVILKYINLGCHFITKTVLKIILQKRFRFKILGNARIIFYYFI